MRTSQRIARFAAGVLIGLSSCDARAPVRHATTAGPADDRGGSRNHPVGKKMKVTVGSKAFTATLDDNPAADKLRAMLPLTLDMSELNGNEKYARLAAPLPTDDANPGTIRAGDLLLWQGDTLVLFYETFRTTYHYTRLGRVDDPAGLAAAVGSGDVKVTFEPE
jgi:hypothetical protein